MRGERGPGMSTIAAMCAGNAGVTGGAEQPDHRVAEGRHDLWDTAHPHLGVVLSVGDVAHPVGAILNVPMRADDLEQVRGTRPVGSQTGDAVGDFLLHVTGAGADAAARGPKDLRRPRPIQIADQGIAALQPPLLQPSMRLIAGVGAQPGRGTAGGG